MNKKYYSSFDFFSLLKILKEKDLVFKSMVLPVKSQEQLEFINRYDKIIPVIKMLPDHSSINRKVEFLGGRIIAHEAIKELLNSSNETDFEIGIGQKGEPLWPFKFVGSITHSNGYVCVLVGEALKFQSIGIDLEHIIDEKKIEKLKDIVLNDFEIDLFKSIQEKISFGEFFTACYSFKESLYKCLFPITGEFIDFNEIEITSLDPSLNQISGRYRSQEKLNVSSITDRVYNGVYLLKNSTILTAIALCHEVLA